MNRLYQTAKRLDYTRQSFNTLTRHYQTGQFDAQRALRLLRNNARDAAKALDIDADIADLHKCARLLMSDWQANLVE